MINGAPAPGNPAEPDSSAGFPPEVDPNTPSTARMYDYYLGGKDNFASDREAAERIIQLVPGTREVALANRAFLGRTVRHLAEAGIRQFIDIGTGLPTQDNVHQVAGREAPGSRVVYVDNDPIVLSHARALLADNPDTIVVEGDAREPEAILGDDEVRAHVDFGRPVAVLLVAILHFIPDDEQVAGIVASLLRPLAPGSHLVISHIYAGDHDDVTIKRGADVYARTNAGSIAARGPEHLRRYFDGLDLVEPGIVQVQAWRPEEDVEVDLVKPGILGVVGRVR
ncbi:SAM-dependent methyltransferase [Streptosporangium album]|uniref:SAM-dependent methyltransferase n=1 Tax=Streptosporangium album TaxID=47479 RepID=A0A7W7S0T2_9ACTN|nr:SAM-dependent methyltransferase [Streptosporangium album]MBB4940856.1 SAM-dependent methyltransferase [Streptosporangium album]